MKIKKKYTFFLLIVSSNLYAVNPNFWNSEYVSWKRGTYFIVEGSGCPTADQSRNGPCTGGKEIITKVELDKAIRNELAQSPYIKIPPRYAKKIHWEKEPISGEGRIGESASYCSGGTEDWVEPVMVSAGKTVTNMACVWVSHGTLGFYLYGSQWTGLKGNAGKKGLGGFKKNAASIDYNDYEQEIIHRSQKFIASTKPQCFRAVFNLDDLQKATITEHNAYIIGVGFDFFDLKTDKDLYLTAIDYQVGSKPEKWNPLPDYEVEHHARKMLQIWENGEGLTVNANTIKYPINFNKEFNVDQTLKVVHLTKKGDYTNPHVSAITLQDLNPIFEIEGKVYKALNAKIEKIDIKNKDGYVEITGFENLPLNKVAKNITKGHLLHAEYW